jgi:hypothetical protein
VHLDHEVVAQGNQEEDAEAASEEGDRDHLPDRRLRHAGSRLGREHVEGRNGEHRAGDDMRGVRTDRLDDDVLRIVLLPGMGGIPMARMAIGIAASMPCRRQAR